MMNKVVRLAIELLSASEGLDYSTLAKQARAYLRTLSEEEYEELKEEALSREDEEVQDEAYSTRLQLLKKIGFTTTEAQAYARMRLNSPGVRRMVARRALCMKLLELEELPLNTTFAYIASTEDRLLKDMPDEEVLKELYG